MKYTMENCGCNGLNFFHASMGLTHWPLGDLDTILKLQFSISFYWLVSSHRLRIIPWDECQGTSPVQVMAWCCQATSHYLSQCWPSSMSPYVVTRPQRVNEAIIESPYQPLTLDVQMTSRKLMFIQLSQLTRCPLYVSPFFNSTNWEGNEENIDKANHTVIEVSSYMSWHFALGKKD